MRLTREQRSAFIAGNCPKIDGQGDCPWTPGDEFTIATDLTFTVERVVRKGESWHLKYVVRDRRHKVRNLRRVPSVPPDWTFEPLFRVDWREGNRPRRRTFRTSDEAMTFALEVDGAAVTAVYRVRWIAVDGQNKTETFDDRAAAERLIEDVKARGVATTPEGLDRAAEESGYTQRLDGPLSDAGETIDPKTQALYSAHAAAKNLAARVEAAGRGADLPIEGQLAEILAEAKRRGVDVGSDLRVIRKRIEAIRGKLVAGSQAA